VDWVARVAFGITSLPGSGATAPRPVQAGRSRPLRAPLTRHVDIPRESLSSRDGGRLIRGRVAPGCLIVPDLVVLKAPPHASEEFVRQVA